MANAKNPNIHFNSLIKQLEDERSLLSVVPETLRARLLEIPEKFLNIPEEELLEALDMDPKSTFRQTAVLDAVRNNFWIEFERAQSDRKSPMMIQNNFLQGVMDQGSYERLSVYSLAYIICKPPTYEAVMAGMQSLATRRLRDILSLPLKKANGEMADPKHIELILKAAAMVDLRNKGGYVARVETKNLTQIDQRTTSVSHVFNQSYGTSGGTSELAAADIDQKILELNSELANLPEPTKPKFHDAVEVEVIEEDA